MTQTGIWCHVHCCIADTLRISYEAQTVKCHDCAKFDCKQTCLFVDYPFIDATGVRCDVLLVGAKASLLSYSGSNSDLHIGIRYDKTNISDYTSEGLRTIDLSETQDAGRWQSCIPLCITRYISKDCDIDMTHMQLHWDQLSHEYAAQTNQRWSKGRYDAREHNCFDYVLAFLNDFCDRLSNTKLIDADKAFDLKQNLVDKAKFTEALIVPRTKLMARYIFLDRKLSNASTDCVDVTGGQIADQN